MKRRKFVWISTASVITVFFPIINCNSELNYVEILANPFSLSYIYTSKNIIEIGEYYNKMMPIEAENNILISLLLKSENDVVINRSINKFTIRQALIKKIRQDFVTNKIVIINGWILSITEARQCALYSLIYN